MDLEIIILIKQSKTRQIYDCQLHPNLKIIQMNLFNKKKQAHRYMENKFIFTKEGMGRGSVELTDTTVFNMLP